MKKLFLLFVILLSFESKSYSQNQNNDEKKIIGRVNLGGDSNYILQYSSFNEQHLYEIIDNKKSGSIIKSFKLIFNDQETFSRNLISNVKTINTFSTEFKDLIEKETQKYFYAFQVMRPAVDGASRGPIAMTMKFAQTAEIRKSVNGSSDFIKRKNLINFLYENKLIITEKDLDYYYSMPHLKFKKEYKNYTKLFSFSDIQKNARGNLLAYLSISEINSILELEQSEDSTYISFYTKLNKNLFDGLRSLEKIRNTGPNYNKKALEEYQKYLRETKTFLLNKIKAAIDIRNDNIKVYADYISLNDSLIESLGKEREFFSNKMKKNIEKKNNLKINIDGINAQLESENKSKEKFRSEKNFLMNRNEPISIEDSFKIVSLDSAIERNNEKIKLLSNFQSDSLNVLNQLEALDSIFNIRINDFNGSIKLIKDKNLAKTALKKENEEFIKKLENIYALELFAAGLLKVKITNIQFEFNNGFLENMIVMTEPIFDFNFDKNLIEPNQKFIKFTNQYPLGFSSKTDLENLRRLELYAVQDKKVEYVLDFKDVVINIEEMLELNRKDYSPKNKAVKDINPETTKERDFHKDNSTRILEAKFFSDLSGINASKPNGLIQLEVDKVIPLLTNRRTKSDTYWPFRWMINKNNNYGFFNYIKPEFTWSKIEQNLRSLDLKLESKPVESEHETTTVNTLYASTLDIRQFEMLSVGADLNIWFLDLPYAKSSFYLNAGFRFGRTQLSVNDSISTNEFGMKGFTNTFQFMPEFGFKINGDERYGLDFSYSPNWVFSDSRGFIQTSDTFGIFETNETFSHQQQNKLHRITLLAYFNITSSTTGRLFFRFRSFHQWDNWSNNFTQYQLGYSFYLKR